MIKIFYYIQISKSSNEVDYDGSPSIFTRRTPEKLKKKLPFSKMSTPISKNIESEKSPKKFQDSIITKTGTYILFCS